MAVYAVIKGIDCHICTDEMKKIRGCEEPKTTPAVIGSYKTDVCPRKFLTGTIANVIEAFAHYKNGMLPNPGTWTDQPNKMLQMFNIIESLITAFDEKS